MRDLDQVPAGVVEDRGRHRADIRWLLRELHAKPLEPLALRVDVLDGERCEGDAVADQRLLEWLGGRMFVGLKHELRAGRVVGRHDRQPPKLPDRDVGLLRKPNTSV